MLRGRADALQPSLVTPLAGELLIRVIATGSASVDVQ
jgi:hypothetical protein